MSEESPVMRMQIDNQDEEDDEAADNVLQRFQMRRTWESRYTDIRIAWYMQAAPRSTWQ